MPYRDPEQQREARRRYEARKARPSGSRRHPGSSHTARNAAVANRPFVGVDGEGANRSGGGHDYFLLSCGEVHTYHREGRELGPHDIFRALWASHLANPMAIHVGYFLGYDITMWLKGLPVEVAVQLLTPEGQAARQNRKSPVPFPVEWEGWDIDVLPNMKRFKLRKRGRGHQWLYVMDTGPFFQTSFLSAIDPAKWGEPICTDTEYAILTEGKAVRSEIVDGPPPPAMLEYNRTENVVLARLMAKFRDGVQNGLGLQLSKDAWYGPGQIAQAYLNKVKAPTSRKIQEASPIEPLDVARLSYFGGWFEIFRHGHVPGPTYEYDINSAYPFVIAGLPCLLHGRWEHTVGKPERPHPYRLVYGNVYGYGNPVGPMPHRTPRGAVLRPLSTVGWFWQHEVEASRRAGLVRRTEFREAWTYHPCDCPPPLAGVVDLYRQRLEAGKNTPQGIALKLGYNSIYGKTAQSQGNPKYGNPVWASLVTAGCRSMILDAIATHPNKAKSLVMVATDGVYFDEPHPNLHVDGTELGAWDAGVRHNLTLFKPGVYWDDKARDAGHLGKLKSRGVPAAALAAKLREIDDLFAQPYRLRWPEVEVLLPFSMVSAKLAVHRGAWETAGRVVQWEPRTESSNPIRKRRATDRTDEGWRSYVYDPVRRPRSMSKVQFDGMRKMLADEYDHAAPVSTGYDKRFGLALEDLERADRGLDTVDGASWSDWLREIQG